MSVAAVTAIAVCPSYTIIDVEGRRHRLDRLAAMDLSRRPAQRFHRGRHDTVRIVLRGQHPGAARRIRQPVVGRRDRFRPDRRCHRDHGGGDLPAAVAYRNPFRERTSRDLLKDGHGHEASCHFDRRGRRVAIDLLRRGDHYRSLPAAVHLERRRGQHFQPDGQDLCLRTGRRPACDLYGHAGAQRDHPAGPCPGDRDVYHADFASHLHAGAEAVACQTAASS